MDHHDIILTLLAKVQFGKVKAFHTGSLQLKKDSFRKKEVEQGGNR